MSSALSCGKKLADARIKKKRLGVDIMVDKLRW